MSHSNDRNFHNKKDCSCYGSCIGECRISIKDVYISLAQIRYRPNGNSLDLAMPKIQTIEQ